MKRVPSPSTKTPLPPKSPSALIFETFTLVHMSNEENDFELELTVNKGREEACDLRNGERHDLKLSRRRASRPRRRDTRVCGRHIAVGKLGNQTVLYGGFWQ